jgi:hypothetical protein
MGGGDDRGYGVTVAILMHSKLTDRVPSGLSVIDPRKLGVDAYWPQ